MLIVLQLMSFSFLLGLDIDSFVSGVKVDSKDYLGMATVASEPYGFSYILYQTTGYSFSNALPLAYGVKSAAFMLRFAQRKNFISEDWLEAGIGINMRVKVIHGHLNDPYQVERVHLSSGISLIVNTNEDKVSSVFNSHVILDVNIPPMIPADVIGISWIFAIRL